jgi:hypothetical protein
MNLSEAQTYLCSKLNLNFTDVNAGANSLFTTTDLNQFLNNGLKRAWDYKPWTFTEKTYMFTIPNPFIGYVDYPNNFEDESVSRLEVPALGEFTKRNFADYQKWFVDYPNDTSRIWCEHERFIFINQFAVTPGQECDISGKLRATPLVNPTDLLPFSPMNDNQENSGNMAIVLLAYSDALGSEKKKNPTGSLAEEKRALAILDAVWKPMGERLAKEQSQSRPFFNTGDLYPQKRNRFNTNIANFP